MTKTNTTTERNALNITATATAAELYTAAEIAASIALRTLHAKTGLDLYADLIRAAANDRKARAAADHATHADTITARREAARATAEEYRRISRRLSIDEDTRTAAADLAREATAEADHAAEEEADTRRAFEGVTYSDRADLVQAAAAALVDTWSNPAEITERRRLEYAAELGKTPEELTPAELEDMQTAANFRKAINAARAASTQLAHPDALNGHTTKATPATPADVAAWLATMGGTGADYRRPAYIKRTKAGECFDTMEYKNGKRLQGWYKIRHYKTVSRYRSLEELNEQNPAALLADWDTAQEAAEAALDIINAARLTDRERAAVLGYLSREAANHAAAVVAEYMTERTKAAEAATTETRRNQILTRARATAETKEAAARWEYALTAAGYTNTKARQRGQAAIIAALHGHHTARAAEQDAPAAVWDGIAWTQNADPAHVAAVAWLTADEAQTARAAARVNPASTIDNATEAAQTAAHVAAMRYTLTQAAANPAAVHALTPDEVTKTAARLEKHRTRAAELARARARAEARAEAAAELAAAREWARTAARWADNPGEILEAMPGTWASRRAKNAAAAARVFLANMTAAEVLNHYRSR